MEYCSENKLNRYFETKALSLSLGFELLNLYLRNIALNLLKITSFYEISCWCTVEYCEAKF